MNAQMYPTESDRIDLFLSLIAHPWATNRGLEIEDDYLEKREGERRWEYLKEIRHPFREDFAELSPKESAKTSLQKLKMEPGKLDAYITAFDSIAPRTKINNEGLLDYFQEGLVPGLRKKLWDMNPGPETLQQWKAAVVIAHSRYEREKVLEAKWRRGSTALVVDPAVPRTTAPVVVRATPAPPAATPPVTVARLRGGNRTMVVGPNGKTLEEYFAQMRGRCSGCGATGHRKDGCGHKDEVCSFCRGRGHLNSVCIDRFLGRAPGGRAQRVQRVAASSETPFSLFAEETDNAGPSTSTDF